MADVGVNGLEAGDDGPDELGEISWCGERSGIWSCDGSRE